MLYLQFINRDYEYEVLDTARLFYKAEEIQAVELIPADVLVCISIGEVNEGGTLGLRMRFGTGAERLSAVIPYHTTAGVAGLEERKRIKWAVKRLTYGYLSEKTGRLLPWGVLTGIRPSKIVHELLDKGEPEQEIKNTLTGFYRVSPVKSDLLYQIAVKERNILDSTPANSVSLYLGIPFCPTRCLYCSFTSEPVSKHAHRMGSFIEALKHEISGVGDIIKSRGEAIQSIYIGGGTPTALDTVLLAEVLAVVEGTFDLSHLREYTLEAGRPDSIDRGKLERIKASKVDRISINPQTMNQRTLELIGRRHTPGETVEAFELARSMGFSNINMDIILGLPGETPEMFEATLKKIEELGPESLTVHTLAVKKASRLNEDKENYKLSDPDDAVSMVELGRQYAGRMGMSPYYLYRQKNILGNLENTGYSKPGFESVYNIQIMEEKQTIIALGPAGVTKAYFPRDNRVERVFNVKNIEEYIARIDEMLERKRRLLL